MIAMDGFSWSNVEMQLQTWRTFEMLVVILTFTLLAQYLQFHWNRRRIYQMASKVPGPFCFPVLGSALYFVGDPYDIFSNLMVMFRAYPSIFKIWLGPSLFYGFSEPKHYELLSRKCLSKGARYRYLQPMVGEGLLTAAPAKWKRHRKIIAPTFNQKILNSFVPIFAEQGDILVEQLKKYCRKGEFDVFHTMSRCTLSIICETAMGVKVNAQTTDAIYTKWTDRALEILFIRASTFYLQYDLIFNRTSMAKELSDVLNKWKNYNESVFIEKKQAFEKRIQQLENNTEKSTEEEPKMRPFLDHLLELTSQEGSKFTDVELMEEVNTFILGGVDTTATTLTFSFITLGLYQDMQQKIFDEIMEVVGPTRRVEPADLPNLKYMERFIKETLRLFPIGPFIMRGAEEDIEIDDYVVPAGASLVFGILKTHTNEEYWPDPYRFDPDRFLPEEVAKRHPCTYIPFSYGPRNCIGIKYAMMVLRVLLTVILRKYKVYTGYKSVQEVQLKTNFAMRPKDGSRAFLQLRN